VPLLIYKERGRAKNEDVAGERISMLQLTQQQAEQARKLLFSQ
jgi:hypothetical protein